MIYENILQFSNSLSKNSALMGLDLGSKTIGVAISDGLRAVATPLKTIKRTKFSDEVKILFHLIAEREISGIILGLPKNMDGSEGPRCQSTRAFARNIIRFKDFPIASTIWSASFSFSINGGAMISIFPSPGTVLPFLITKTPSLRQF